MKSYLVMGDRARGNDNLDGVDDAAFWNWYLPHSAETGDSMLEGGKTSSSTSGLKSLVQSVKGEAERNAIANALEQARWNRKAAARLLKVSYRTLLYKIEQYHMSPPTSHLSGYGNGGVRERSLYQKASWHVTLAERESILISGGSGKISGLLVCSKGRRDVWDPLCGEQ